MRGVFVSVVNFVRDWLGVSGSDWVTYRFAVIPIVTSVWTLGLSACWSVVCAAFGVVFHGRGVRSK